ncbi:hypothetical protein MHU86_12311 [Fragilaria crotonensis]|nr:hypothetical protein MHU86_12311 [Fragilaria crotonensis]
MLEFCAQGFWTVLPLSVALSLPGLRLSPLGVVPQRDRRSRLIVDYTYSGVNEDTARLAPPEAMQFGKALQRFLTKVVHAAPSYGPVYLAKIDIADGFYRIGLYPRDIPRLGVILPTTEREPLVALPLALPMGWVESPPYFTAVTETACDLLNAALRRGWDHPPPHPLESLAATQPATPVGTAMPSTTGDATPGPVPAFKGSPGTNASPLAYGDVYVDDFLLAAQTKRHQQRVLRTALHAIDRVLRPLAATDRSSRKEPVSTKKLRQGDAYWATRKTILGWDFDTVAGTLNLPPHRLDRLYALLDAFPPTRRRAPVGEWHRLLGELRSMTAALPGARGLFSALQDSLRAGDRHRVRLSRLAHASLADFRAIADTLRVRPTRFRELIPVGTPVAHGACDACQKGMGGVWFFPDAPPVVWRAAFPLALQRALITSSNRRGTLSISDLELAGTLAHKQVLTQVCPGQHLAERPVWLAGDNRPALAWATKGSATSSTARAYLLRLTALHQRHFRYVPQHDFIAGKSNVMADDAKYLLEVDNPGTRDALRRDWSAVTTTLDAHQSAHRNAATATTAGVWERFCTNHGLRTDLLDVPGDLVPVLLLFAQQYRTGRISPSDRPVRSRTVEDAVRQVAQAFTRVGANDPRLNSFGDLDFRLRALLQAWKRADPPPTRVKPVPLSLVRQAHTLSSAAPPDSGLAAAGDCLLLAYYFLLRPGEYSGHPRTTEDDLFRLQDVGVMIGHRRLAPLTCPIPDLLATTFVSLTFTSQKNGVRGETIGHGRSGHPTLCPVHALVGRLLQLRRAGAVPTTPINAFRHPGAEWQFVLAADITALLRRAAPFVPQADLDARDFSARCTRAGGAMALLCGGIGSDRIRLIGRWRSDEVYRYLHVQAQPVMAGAAAAMLHGGDFRLHNPPSPPGLPPGGPPFS